MSAATVLDELKKAKTVKYGKITIKVPVEFKEKIEFIVNNNDINMSDYLGALLEKSEINKVYIATKKAVKESGPKEVKEPFGNTDSNTVES